MAKKKYITLEWRKKLGYKSLERKKPTKFVTINKKRYKVDTELWKFLSSIEEDEERQAFMKKLKKVG